ncbi:hypothetical protein [Halomonas piscis]|uniref:hypothetical protein n=1 Tax=Halomonas piscis TaxID=3031727 RepID=UPI00289B46B1|nr:hypothetical protein [Halomonas piscis]
MLRIISTKKLLVSQIVISEDITPPIRRMLLTYPPMMRNAEDLSIEAIRAASILAPPIVYEKKRNPGKGAYWCIGNIRTALCTRQLGGRERVRCVVVEPPNVTAADQVALALLLAEKSCLMLDPASADGFLLGIYTALQGTRRKKDLTDISKSFGSKKAFLESFGINRRKK